MRFGSGGIGLLKAFGHDHTTLAAVKGFRRAGFTANELHPFRRRRNLAADHGGFTCTRDRSLFVCVFLCSPLRAKTVRIPSSVSAEMRGARLRRRRPQETGLSGFKEPRICPVPARWPTVRRSPFILMS